MAHDVTRRDFLTTSAALVVAAQVPRAVAQTPACFCSGRLDHRLRRNRDSAERMRRARSAPASAARRRGGGWRRTRRGFQVLQSRHQWEQVPDLQQRWTADAIDLKPDVLSILIGVNDFWHKLDHGTTARCRTTSNSTARCCRRRATPCRTCISFVARAVRAAHGRRRCAVVPGNSTSVARRRRVSRRARARRSSLADDLQSANPDGAP